MVMADTAQKSLAAKIAQLFMTAFNVQLEDNSQTTDKIFDEINRREGISEDEISAEKLILV